MADRYLKVILTVIACELLWLGVRDTAPPVQAQAQPAPVIVTGFRSGDRDFSAIPVAVVGEVRAVAGHSALPNVEPLKVRVLEPVRFDSREPLTVQTGAKPLSVESVPARPGARPGL